MSPLTGILIIILISLGITGIILGNWMKGILNENGFKALPLVSYGGEIFNMAKLIRGTKDIDLKRKYKRLLRSIIIVGVLFICSAILLIITGFEN